MIQDTLMESALQIDDLEQYMRRHADKPRLARHIYWMLRSPAPGRTLLHMHEQARLPGLTFLHDAPNITAGPVEYHSGSVLEHIARVMDEVHSATDGDPIAIWMAFVHDAGKLTTPRGMLPHHYGHEIRGEQMAKLWGKAAGLPDPFVRAGMYCAFHHMRAGKYGLMQRKKKLRFLLEVARTGLMERFWAVASADSKSNIGDVALAHWYAIRDIVTDGEFTDQKRTQCLGIIKHMETTNDIQS